MILLFGCVAKLGVGGVKWSTSVRAFQCTKERWISLSRSKVMTFEVAGFGFDGFPSTTIFQISGNFLEKSC